LLSDGVAGQQEVVLLGPLFDFGLILIEGLETLDVDVGDVVGVGLLDVGGVGEDADLSGEGVTLRLEYAWKGSLTTPLNLLSGS
jgi:hypothetical protein